MKSNRLPKVLLGGLIFLLGVYLIVLEIGITISEYEVFKQMNNKMGAVLGISFVILLGVWVAYRGLKIITKKN